MKKQLNKIRKYLFLKMTERYVVKPKSFHDISFHKQSIKNILVIRPNHRLGNLILMTALIQELENTFPQANIDIVVKGGLAKVIFKNYSSISHIFQLPKNPFIHPIKYLSLILKMKRCQYDLAINAVCNSSSGRIFTNISQAKIKISDSEFISKRNESEDKPLDYDHIAKHQIYHLRSYL